MTPLRNNYPFCTQRKLRQKAIFRSRGLVALNHNQQWKSRPFLFMLRSRHFFLRISPFWPCLLFCPWLVCGAATLRHVGGGSVCWGGGYMVFSCCEDGRRFEWHSIVFEVFEQFEIVRRSDCFEAAVAPFPKPLITFAISSRLSRAKSRRDGARCVGPRPDWRRARPGRRIAAKPQIVLPHLP